MTEHNVNPTRTEARLRNQLRIHWSWLKKEDYMSLGDFIMAIFNASPTEQQISKPVGSAPADIHSEIEAEMKKDYEI